MANNKTTYTLQIDAEINSLEKKFGTIQSLMQNVMNSADAPKGLEKTFEKIGGLIDKIRTKASTPIDSKGGFTSIGKDIEAVNIALGGLHKAIGSVSDMSDASKISFLPPEAQKEVATIIKSIESYQAAIASATAETSELIEARKELAKAETAKSKADADLELKQQSLDRAKQEQKNAQAAIDAINERKAALDDLLKRQEEIEKFYSAEGADGKKPNRSKKYDGVSMRPQDIKRQITNQEARMVGDADELEKQSKALKQAKIDVESYERQVGTAQRRWNDANETFDAAAKAVETLNATFESGSIEKKQAAYASLKNEADKLGIKISDLNDEFSETDANTLTQRLIELKQKGLKSVTDAMDNAQAETREMGMLVRQTSEEVKESTAAWKENTEATAQKDAFENKIKSFLGVAGAAQVMRHALRDAMQTITELDKTMTEMSVVTDLEVGDYWDQLPQYTKRANELGLAISDVYKADTLYYQQGLKTNEVVAISTETMKMARIAGLDTAEATDRMTAALRGFNMELNETSAVKIADVYSELAAITAADVDEISTAMTKTASIASSAGMEFETTAAFLSQIIETTRESAETAGTAMKTVIARFQELKKAPDEIGEIDGEIVDANAIETALRSVGVELRDTGGQFRELDDVFLELSSKWDGLDKNTQRYIATIAAGSRQQSRFIAMMSDYSRTQELVTAANTSAGASNRQFEKTMDSLESKIEKLKNTWHEFTMGIMNSDLVKAGVDILTKFLEVINRATDAFDGMGGSIAKIATVFVVFKTGQKIFEKLKAPLVNFFAEIVARARETGEAAGEAAKEGLEKSRNKQNKTEDKEQTAKQKKAKEQKVKAIQTAISNKAQWKKEDGGGKTIREEVSKLPQKAKELPQKAKAALSQVPDKIKDTLDSIKSKASAPIQDAKQIKSLKQEINNDKLSLAINESLGNVATSGHLKDRIQQNEETLGGAQDRQKQRAEAVKSTISNVASGAGELLMGDSFTSAKQHRAEMRESGGKIAKLSGQIQEKSSSITQQKNNLDNLQNKKGGINDLKAQKLELEAIAKSEKATAKEREKAKNSLSRLNQKLIKQEEEYANAEAELAASEEEYANLNNSFNEESEKYLKAQEGMWKDIGDGISSAGEKITGVGVAASMLGGVFQELGLEGLGETFSTLGQVATVFGTALTALGPVIATVGKIGTSIATQLTAAGWSTQAAWWWVVLIVAAVAALIALIAVLIKKAADNSPEKKLERAKQAADAAAEAADAAAEAYKNLSDAFDELDNKYKALEDLTRGTKEWNEAVKEINSSVIELIEAYPELASLIKNKSGVLTIDIDGKEAQDILRKYQKDAVSASIAASSAKIDVNKGQKEVSKEKLIDTKLWRRSTLGQDRIGNYGEALAGGVIGKDESGNFIILEGQEEMAKELGITKKQLKRWKNALKHDEETLRDYGETVLELEAQTETLYESMALQAKELINTAGWTEEDKQQLNQLITEEDMKRYENEVDKVYEDKSNKDVEADLKAYIEKQSGVSRVKNIRENKVVYFDSDGKRHVEDRETWLNKMKSEKVTEKASQAGEAVPGLVDRIADKASQILNIGDDGTSAKEAVNALFSDIEGGKLTHGQMQELSKLSDERLTAMFDELGEDAKKVFGDSETFVKQFKGTLEKTTDQFAKAGEAARSFMTAEQAVAFKRKLDEVAELKNGKTNVENILNATDKLLGGTDLTDQERSAIWERISLTDWSNLEQLKMLQIDLIQKYGMSAEAAKEYTTQLAQSAHATSNLATTIEAFGELYQANQQVERSLKKISELQWEYSKALEKGSDNIGTILEEQMAEYQKMAQGYSKGYEENITNMEKIWGQMQDTSITKGYDLSMFTSINEDGSLNTTNESTGLGVQDLYGSIKDDSVREKIKELIENYTSEWSASQDKLEGLRDTIDNIENLEADGQEAFYELRDMAKETILDSLQKQIDLQTQTLEATQEANSQLISKIQEQIDETRADRERQKAEESLEDLRSQQAYLAMDTSGSNELQTLELEKQIQEEEENLQQTLVDQAIQNLSDANEKAAMQRERQIAIAEQQLDTYSRSEAFQAEIDRKLQEMISANTAWQNTELGQMLTQKFTEGMSVLEKTEWQKSIAGKVGNAEFWTKSAWGEQTAEIYTAIEQLPEEIANSIEEGGTSRSISAQASTLSEAGFDMSQIGLEPSTNADGTTSYKVKDGAETKDVKSALEKFQSIYASDSDYKNSQAYKDLESENLTTFGGYLSRDEYYTQYSKEIAEGKKGSYTEYLASDDAKDLAKTALDNKIKQHPFGVPGSVTIEQGTKWKNNKTGDMNLKIDETTDNAVRFSGSKADEHKRNALDSIAGGYSIVYEPNTGHPDSEDDSLGLKSTLWVKGKGGDWATVKNQEGEEAPLGLRNAAIEWRRKNIKYETGGLADFTGPAWLDGTKSRPEYVLNAAQTKRFFSLIDVLERYDEKSSGTGKSGDNYFEIEINVEKLENDYDVEQVANKIRSMIYDDATYRNVNAINHIR